MKAPRRRSATKRPLTSEQLGDLGEDLFKADCSKAKIVCNPVRRDRYGWDAILEFEQREGLASYDHRPVPLSCHVQVKTIWSDGKSVKLKLSAAERLAKEPKPTFVVVNKVAQDLTVSERVIIQMLDTPLSKILKHLRRASAEGKTKLNSEFVYFDTTKNGTLISSSPDALRGAIETAIGLPLTMQDYIRRKDEQLRTLGFTSSPVTLSITMDGVKRSELIDGMLGLRTIPLASFRATETRFDIPLEMASNSGGNAYISFTPTKQMACTVSARMKGGAAPAVLQGEFSGAALPGLPDEFKALVKGELFETTLTKTNFSWNAREDVLKAAEMPIDIWLNFFRFCRILTGEASVRLEAETLPTIELPYRNAKHTFNKALVSTMEEVCANAERLRNIVGVVKLPITLTELQASANDVSNCLMFADNAGRGQFLKLNVERQKDAPHILPSPCAYFSMFPIGPLMVAYCVLADLECTWRGKWGSVRLTAKEFQEVSSVNDDAGFEAFVDRQMKALNLKSMVRYPSERIRIIADAA